MFNRKTVYAFAVLASFGIGLLAASVFLPTNENYLSFRVDHKISDHDSMFARYTFDDASGVSPQD